MAFASHLRGALVLPRSGLYTNVGLSSEGAKGMSSFPSARLHVPRRHPVPFHSGCGGGPLYSKQHCHGNKLTSFRFHHRLHMSASKYNGQNCDIPDENEYIAAQVVDAVRMVPSQNQLFMTMTTGEEVAVAHVNQATAGRLLYSTSTPTIFLRMTHDNELILPIVVGEVAIGLLMKGFRKEQGCQHLGRPDYYELLATTVLAVNYEIRMVKITERVGDTYYSRIYLGKPGEPDMISIDARPSDAINLAVRAQVPIYVSTRIVSADAVRVVRERAASEGGRGLNGSNFVFNAFLDSPSKEFDSMTEELALIKGMIKAADEERYADAARMRDALLRLRDRNKPKLNKVDVWFKKFKEVGKQEMY